MEGDTITCSIGTLQYASFRGVPFWVKSDKGGFGRRIATHEYPRRDDPYNEDMGKKCRTFNVTGYVVGDDARFQKDALVAACEAYGSALLVLPAEIPQNCVCPTLVVQRNKDDQGIFELEFEFKEDPLFGINPIGIPVFESLIGGVFSAAFSAVNSFFYAGFDTSYTLPYVAANAASRVQAFAQQMTGALESLGLPDQKPVIGAMTDLIGLYQNADALVQPGSSTSAEDVALPAVINKIFSALQAIPDPSVAIDAMTSLASFSALEQTGADGTASYGSGTPVVIYSVDGSATYTVAMATKPGSTEEAFVAPSDAKDAANAAAFNGMVRIFALILLAKGIAASKFADRQTAIQARANLVELFDQQMERTMQYDIAISLQTARDYCVKSITDQIASIVPLVHVSSPVTLPSIYWAGRLYNDATRALELSERNRVPTPAFMPQEFDALAS